MAPKWVALNLRCHLRRRAKKKTKQQSATNSSLEEFNRIILNVRACVRVYPGQTDGRRAWFGGGTYPRPLAFAPTQPFGQAGHVQTPSYGARPKTRGHREPETMARRGISDGSKKGAGSQRMGWDRGDKRGGETKDALKASLGVCCCARDGANY